jgi:3D (Asp-Asp-Asp) domain-containing protein
MLFYVIIYFLKTMRTLSTNQLSRAEKFVLCAVFAALLTTSSKPQVVRAESISAPAFEATMAATPDEPVPTPSLVTIKKTLFVTATAYSSTPDQTDATPFITSNGLRVYDGLIAANWLPYNTKIRIPDMFGDKIFTVNDRMNPRYDTGRLDVWMPSRVDAKQFGIRHIRIQIVE